MSSKHAHEEQTSGRRNDPTDQEQRIRLLEARIHAQERYRHDQRRWAIALILIMLAHGALSFLLR